jgi:hypothetical protein
MKEVPAVADIVSTGAGQLQAFAAKIRQVYNRNYTNTSTQTPDAAWPYDMWADLWNECVWDGYDFDPSMADVPDDAKRSLVGLIRTIGARQARIEDKLDRLLEGK